MAAVLFLFLFNVRTAFISLTAIPLSLLGAVLVLWAGGVSLNTLTLGGLAIAVGEVVDDAIIDVENITRRLRQNRLEARPSKPFGVVLRASLEVRSAVLYASLIVVFVCLPIFFMGGVAGAFFRPLAVAYILAVLASLGVALTVTPALSMMLLPQVAGVWRVSPPTAVTAIRCPPAAVRHQVVPLRAGRHRAVPLQVVRLRAGRDQVGRVPVVLVREVAEVGVLERRLELKALRSSPEDWYR